MNYISNHSRKSAVRMRRSRFLACVGLALSGSVLGCVNADEPATPAPAKALPTLFLIGDSTVNNGTKGQQGWGTSLAPFFDTAKINILNRARGGRSSRTFLSEGLWAKVLEEIRPGDTVLMQFGHNDGGSPRTSYRASLKGNSDETQEFANPQNGQNEPVHSFGWYLRKYVADAKAKGATPIVLSLVPRNDWKEGKVLRASEGYGKWAREAAAAGGAAFIDLNTIVANYYDALGQEQVKAFFPHEHTHTDAAGAELNARAVVEGLKSMKDAPLNAYLSPLGVEVGPADSALVVQAIEPVASD
ncbi:MAG TPA: rhamnogalacturonan acetylesterase [Abditibacteriaceae bacterium]|jgi:lysophospholipase L1-like esterase